MDELLSESDEDALIVTHGWLMLELRKELMKRGFHGPSGLSYELTGIKQVSVAPKSETQVHVPLLNCLSAFELLMLCRGSRSALGLLTLCQTVSSKAGRWNGNDSSCLSTPTDLEFEDGDAEPALHHSNRRCRVRVHRSCG